MGARTSLMCRSRWAPLIAGPFLISAGIGWAADPADSPTLQLLARAKANYVPQEFKKTVVTFEDDEQVPLRIVSSQPGVSVAGPLAVEYAALERAASEGSAEIAFVLYEALSSCRDVPASVKDLENAVARMRSEPVVSNRDIEYRLQKLLIEPFTFCKGVTAEQRMMADAWLVRAAAMGHSGAAALYAHKLGNSGEAIAWLEAAWNGGEGGVLPALAQLYRAGHSGPPVRKPDPVRAYAYQYLYTRILEEGGPEPIGRLRAKIISDAKAELSEMERELREGQRGAAVAQAKALLKVNARCCKPV